MWSVPVEVVEAEARTFKLIAVVWSFVEDRTEFGLHFPERTATKRLPGGSDPVGSRPGSLGKFSVSRHIAVVSVRPGITMASAAVFRGEGLSCGARGSEEAAVVLRAGRVGESASSR